MLFTIGVIGTLTRRNALIVFMCIELMLNAVNLTFITFSRFLQSMDGVLFAFFVIAVAAAEAAVGLAIFVMIYRSRETINLDEINILKW
jgi:NADH-quinone oxidoreductase subunit K